MDFEDKYGTLNVQRKLLQLLQSFDWICLENEIKYSVSSGTMLGAIRHQGFIPWDDDVDITIERKYYDRLMAAVNEAPSLVCEKGLWLDRVRFKDDTKKSALESNPTIDVFVWDHVPDNRLLERMKYYSIAFLQGTIKDRPDYARFSWSNKVMSFITYYIGKIIPLSAKLRTYSWIAQWGNGQETLFQAGYHDQFNALRFRYPFHLLDKVERRRFEDIEVNVMVKYDEYLKIIYGDHYMTPPTEANRKPTHTKKTKI